MSAIPESDATRLERAIQELGEHFDSVQIFVSVHAPTERGKTFSATRGCGNWFSRYGQVREWLLYEDERIRTYARGQEGDEISKA